MNIITIFFIAISLAMDAFAVSISNGIALRESNVIEAIKFGGFFGFFQFVMPIIGFYAAKFFNQKITKIDHWIAFILLFIIGFKMINEARKEKKDGSEERDDYLMSFKELTILAIATSIDALAVGVSLAVIKVEIFFAAIVIGIVTFCLSFIGVIMGKGIGLFFRKNAEILGGAILIFIGFKILVEHLFF